MAADGVLKNGCACCAIIRGGLRFYRLAFGLGGVVPPQHSSHRRQRAIAGIVASTCYLYLARTGSPQCSVQRLGKGEKGRLGA